MQKASKEEKKHDGLLSPVIPENIFPICRLQNATKEDKHDRLFSLGIPEKIYL